MNINYKLFKEKTLKKLTSNKKILPIVIVSLAVVIFILASSCIKSESKTNTTSNESKIVKQSSSYNETLERKLENMLITIDSVKKVSVMVVLESDVIVNYLTESATDVSGKTTTTVVYEKNGSAQKPVVVSTIMPKIVGVLIITNKTSSSTKVSILNSVATVLNVSTNCISILQEG